MVGKSLGAKVLGILTLILSIAYILPVHGLLASENAEYHFAVAPGDTRQYDLIKDMTMGKEVATNVAINIKVISISHDKGNVEVRVDRGDESYFDQLIAESPRTCNYYVRFLQATVDSAAFWTSYAQNASFYSTETNYTSVTLEGDSLTVDSKNERYGAWRCLVGNEFKEKRNWRTGWLEYYYLKDVLSNFSTFYEYEYTSSGQEPILSFTEDLGFLWIPVLAGYAIRTRRKQIKT